MSSLRSTTFVLAAVALGSWIGCAGPGPKLFPAAPLETKPLADGGVERAYDTDGDGRADYRERLSAAGRIVQIGYSAAKGGPTQYVELDTIPTDQRRHLVLLLDSVSYALVRDAWAEGRFRYCARPARTISPFPVMSDLSFSEFFGCSPATAIESAYFDGKRLTNGYDVYANDGNTRWARYVDYRLKSVAHAPAYLDPYPWFSSELRKIQDLYLKRSAPMTVAYCLGTSAAGARYGQAGHRAALAEVDRYCHWLLYTTRGRARFTLLSDHGHSYFESRRIPLADRLSQLGYHVRQTLEKPGDVVVPEFAMVTCAAIHTKTPQRVASDVLQITGIDLSIYRDESGDVIVQNRTGRASIAHSPAGYRYRPDRGDPLQLLPIMDRLTKEGRVDDDGFISDRVLFDATVDAVYPDVLHRLWRTFHGLIEHTPDVVVSVDEGYHCGSAMMTAMVRLLGVHGNLKQASSSAFAMTGEGELPPVLRMEDLRSALRRLGVAIPGRDGVPPTGSVSNGRER